MGFLFTHLFDNRFDEFSNRQKALAVLAFRSAVSVSTIDFIGVIGIRCAKDLWERIADCITSAEGGTRVI